MLVVIYLAARWISRRFSLGAHGRGAQVGVGILGLVLLLGAEIGFVLQLRGTSLADYVAERDPVAGTVYAVALVLFAAMPTLVSKSNKGIEREANLRSFR